MKHETLAEALAAAQAEMVAPTKDNIAEVRMNSGGKFEYRYADLASIRAACVPALNAHGIAVIQPIVPMGDGWGVKTVLLWEDQRLECDPLPLLLGKHDMQGLGSAITYARRYGLQMMAGIAADDDDGGEAASAAAPEGRAPAPSATRANPARDVEDFLREIAATPDHKLGALKRSTSAARQMLAGADQARIVEAYQKRAADMKAKQAKPLADLIGPALDECTEPGQVEAVVDQYQDKLVEASLQGDGGVYDDVQQMIDAARERTAAGMA